MDSHKALRLAEGRTCRAMDLTSPSRSQDCGSCWRQTFAIRPCACGAAQPRSTHPPRVQTEHALDNAVELLRHMHLSLAPAIFVALRVAVVVELHAKRFV